MAVGNKFNGFVNRLAEGVHDLANHTLKVYLTNATPNPAMGNAIRANLAEIAAGNGYTTGGIQVFPSGSEDDGTYTMLIPDSITWTATGSAMAAFRYAVLYNDTPTDPADPLIAWWDAGQEVVLQPGSSWTLEFDPVNGALRLT
jgi:hypothetical protein